MKTNTDVLLLVVDLAGTFLFAVEGATAAIGGQLDFFGLMVLAFATSLGGGIIRDLLIGAVPPNAIRDWRYGVTAFIAATVVFCFHRGVERIPASLVIVLDAAGLGLFAMAGAMKALTFGIHPVVAVLMGTITGVGGGAIRDLFLVRIPIVLRADIYAVAAMVGSAVMIAGVRLGAPRLAMMVTGGVVCFVLRMMSVWQHWNLPNVMAP